MPYKEHINCKTEISVLPYWPWEMRDPTGTRRNNNVIMTSKRRRDSRFDVIMTLLLRRVSVVAVIV